MKNALVGIMTGPVLLTGAPVHSNVAAAPSIPGCLCKVADIVKKEKTSKRGLVICKREEDRTRWKQATAGKGTR